FDQRRPRTPLARLVEEYEAPRRFDRQAHFAEWVELVCNVPSGDPAHHSQATQLMEMDFSIHYNVWTSEDVRNLIEFTRREWRLDWQPAVFWPAHFYRKETIVLLRRGKPRGRLNLR